jgi:hypothetical protein
MVGITEAGDDLRNKGALNDDGIEAGIGEEAVQTPEAVVEIMFGLKGAPGGGRGIGPRQFTQGTRAFEQEGADQQGEVDDLGGHAVGQDGLDGSQHRFIA